MAVTRNKRFLHKIYDTAGAYVGTLPDTLVANKPSYSWQINGGLGEMKIILALDARTFQSTYESTIVSFGYRVKSYVQGADESTTTQIYDGIISSYTPRMSADGKETVEISVVSQTVSLENTVLKSGTATQVTYTSQDPTAIFKDIIDKYAGTINYSASSWTLTGTTVTYVYTFSSTLDAIKKCLEIAPAYWYWMVDQSSVAYFKRANFDTADHTLLINKHINQVEYGKSIDKLKNVVYFKGGGTPPLYYKYSRTSSITAYGTREILMSDERVTLSATASTIATKFLDENDHPITLVRARVIDNSNDTLAGYDIESLKVGQTIKLADPDIATQITLWNVASWDVDFWDFDIRYSLGVPLQITSINYGFDYADIECTMLRDDVAHRIEDISRNLDVVRSEGIPTTPS